MILSPVAGMIEEQTNRRLAEIREPSVVKEETKEGWPCFVHHPDAGGPCERPAVMEVYGLPFCEVHGMDAKAGAIAELYQEAAWFIERPLNPHVPGPGPVAARVLGEAAASLERHIDTGAEREAIQRAYPFLEERMDEDARDYDYAHAPGPGPIDWNWDDRLLIHKLMRLAHAEGASGLVEMLEEERERASAQLSFALVDSERRAPGPKV